MTNETALREARYRSIQISDIAELLHYEPTTGEFRWKPRPVRFFKSEKSQANWNAKFAGRRAFTTQKGRRGELRGAILGCQVQAHIIAWALFHGSWPSKQIDHINGRADDNRINNLRDVSHLEQQRNRSRPVTNKSGVVGVCYDRKKRRWLAQINNGRRTIRLGRFVEKSEAIAARRAAEKQLGYHQNHGRP